MSALVINTEVDGNSTSFDLIQTQIESLSSKMDKLINIQQKVLSRLDGMSQEIDDIESDMENLKIDKEDVRLSPRVVNHTQVIGGEVRGICQEMSTIMSVVNQRSELQAKKIEGMEKLVLSMQQVISFIGKTVKSSKVMELMFKGPAAQKSSKPKDSKGKQAIKRKSSDKLKDHKGNDGAEKPCLSSKGLKVQKKTKPPDTADTISLKKQTLLLEKVQKLNKQNAEKSGHQLTSGYVDLEAGKSPKHHQTDAPACTLADYLPKESQVAATEKHEVAGQVSEEGCGETAPDVITEKEPKLNLKDAVKEIEEEKLKMEKKDKEAAEVPACDDKKEPIPTSTKEQKDQTTKVNSPAITTFVTEEHFVVEEQIMSHVVLEQGEKEDRKQDGEEDEQKLESEGWAIFTANGVEIELNQNQMVEWKENDVKKEDDDIAEQYFIDTTPPPVAPFNHRIVSAKPNQISNFYTISWQEVLGGGRFGQVHKCVENSSGLTLAAKVIKAKNQKEKDVVKNEIQVMNNLDHANLIQLYAAYESRNDIILVLEYVGGGELFDRIIDENYTLMELDAVVFIKQICEGLQYMHKMYILHLDLKPENILCVSRVTNKIKIIDFGLARIYKPREKLRVNFGTPEFLAPEVINYDFVSFNTDMWSLGVITYMLLSGLSPFLGDDDNETLNNILACQWNFEEQEFVDTSEEAKDFISRLLVANKCWRTSASEALRHPWLANPMLHHQLHTKKTMCRSRRSSCVPTTDS
ncbi:myosin light chain kinase 2, skeletal/cardiac muscle isoform X2 [Channa argus]|uniref:myosin light chain kinase 2, skeletal/cardiac muscle isoform X2 n=1 Tax=Channa argus TaxID=215402 RepID=UPI00352113D4